jgi:hypothetical protein
MIIMIIIIIIPEHYGEIVGESFAFQHSLTSRAVFTTSDGRLVMKLLIVASREDD